MTDKTCLCQPLTFVLAQLGLHQGMPSVQIWLPNVSPDICSLDCYTCSIYNLSSRDSQGGSIIFP